MTTTTTSTYYSTRPSRAALVATYAAPPSAEELALRARASEFRACGDHVAAGLLERDLAALLRMEHTGRARAWDAADDE